MSQPVDRLATEERLVQQASEDREGFRLAATRAFAGLNPRERQILRGVTTKNVSAEDALDLWQQALRATLADLHKTETGSVLWKALSKNLAYDDDDAKKLARQLVSDRRCKLLKEKIKAFYSDGAKRQGVRLLRLLARPEEELDDLYRRYGDHLAYHEIARAQKISVSDPHTSWYTRRKAARAIRRERRQTALSERDRLLRIASRRDELHAAFDGLLGEAVTRAWDLPVVIDLRMQYEKKVRTLAEADAHNPVKRLSLFEKVTRAFRDAEVEKLAKNNPAHNSLVSARHFAEEIDALLLRIFDLSNVQKNRLLTLAKEERDLAKEQASIQECQARRKRLLTEELSFRQRAKVI